MCLAINFGRENNVDVGCAYQFQSSSHIKQRERSNNGLGSNGGLLGRTHYTKSASYRSPSAILADPREWILHWMCEQSTAMIVAGVGERVLNATESGNAAESGGQQRVEGDSGRVNGKSGRRCEESCAFHLLQLLAAGCWLLAACCLLLAACRCLLVVNI
jgi:hypothetical protein